MQTIWRIKTRVLSASFLFFFFVYLFFLRVLNRLSFSSTFVRNIVTFTMHIFVSILLLGLLCTGTVSYKSKYSIMNQLPQRANTELNAEPKKSILVNDDIQHPVVRLLVPKGDNSGDDEMIGVFSIERALEEARRRELDLVLINERSDPPVCKVVDVGKFNYMLEKRRKEQSKKQVKVETKEIKLSPSIEQHDFDVRVRAALKFLADGDRVSLRCNLWCGFDSESSCDDIECLQVKTILQFKGREMQHTLQGRELLLRFFDRLQECAVLDAQPKLEGRSMFMTISPKRGAR